MAFLNITIDKPSPRTGYGAGTTVATAVVSGGTAPYTYRLTTGGDKFAINSSTGVVTTIAAMDINNIASFMVTATDSTSGTPLTVSSSVEYPSIQAKIGNNISKENTIYKITRDIDLGHGSLAIPAGCTLDFQGGSFRNGTIIGNYTKINAGLLKIFDTTVTISGTWDISVAYPEWFGAIPNNVADCTLAIQSTINSFKGIIMLSVGNYRISNTLILRSERILSGCGAGAYFSGSSGTYSRISALIPVRSFMGDRVISVDPKDTSDEAYYSYGVAVRNLCIDCVNIADSNITIIALMSTTNPETFQDVRIINNNNNIGLWIDRSNNKNGSQSDGIVISNFVFLNYNANTSVNPVVIVGDCNEVSFRDCKFQKNSNDKGSVAVLVNAKSNISSGGAANGITFDSCSFTSAYYGINVVGNTEDANGPRYVRVVNGTWEYCTRPIQLASEDVYKPVQFCSIGPGNRINTRTAEAKYDILLNLHVANCMIYATDDMKIYSDASYAMNNFIIGGANSASSISDKDCWISQVAGKFVIHSTNNWTGLSLLNGWTNGSVNRTSASYLIDPSGWIHLRGYLKSGTWGYPNYIFTLPAEAKPAIAQEISLGNNTLRILEDGNVYAQGAGDYLLLDGVNFSVKPA